MFHITSAFFANAADGHILRVSLTRNDGGAEIQVAYNHADKTGDERWTKIIDYADVDDDIYEMTIGSSSGIQRAHGLDGNDMLRHLQADGLYLKGHGYTVNNVELLDSDGNVVTGIDGITSDNTDTPVEIYTITGIRVAEPEPGNIYIVCRGSKVSKIRF